VQGWKRSRTPSLDPKIDIAIVVHPIYDTDIMLKMKVQKMSFEQIGKHGLS
jgi:hypothetical protein